jgi:formylmethanofuran dehydrogenase subunit E
MTEISTRGPRFSDVVRFHGHSCPGLAIGYRMVVAAMDTLRELRACDEELVAIVENDACGIDAVQVVAGCTFGKGNLVFLDYGKPVYTLFSRKSGKGVRVAFHGGEPPEDVRDDREARVRWILTAPAEDLLDLREVQLEEPPPARISGSVACAFCGERVMETRIRQVDGKPACIPCAEARSGS